MLAPKMIPLVLKQVIRHRTRSALTICGIATAMFLYCAVEAMQNGLREATESTAKDAILVVYREDRYCPFTSRLPEFYFDRIQKIQHVKNVTPMKIIVNNCRASLDVVTFRGVPVSGFIANSSESISIKEGSFADWKRRSDAALIGEVLANRRGLKVGDQFDAAGITVYVAGIIRSENIQDHNVGYVHLDFLQQAADKRLGTVTQFNVKVDDPQYLDVVAKAIDEEFKSAQEPTMTSSEKSFVARAAKDVIEIVGFTRWLGLGCLAAVLALVGNAIVLSTQDRIREHAVLQTLGFNQGLIGRLIVAEGLVLGLLGGVVGTLASTLVLYTYGFSLTNEGLSIHFTAGPEVWISGLVVSTLLGVVAGLVPAWQASRREIAPSFRA